MIYASLMTEILLNKYTTFKTVILYLLLNFSPFSPVSDIATSTRACAPNNQKTVVCFPIPIFLHQVSQFKEYSLPKVKKKNPHWRKSGYCVNIVQFLS